MRRLLLTALLAPAALAAQTRTDGTLCERVDDSRHPEARATVMPFAQATDGRGAFFAGCLLMAGEKYKEAASAFERAVKADDASAVAHFFLGRAYGAQAQRANVLSQPSLARKTKREFDRAVQLDPSYVDAREGLFEYYVQAPGIMGGSKDKARAQVEEIRRLDAYRGGALAATLAGREKNWSQAAAEYERLTRQFPDSGAVWLALAYAQGGQLGQWDAAFATIERMQKALPAWPVAHYAVGRLAAESGRQLDRGERALRTYLASTPKTTEPQPAAAHYRLGMIAERRGQKDAARAEYQTAVTLDPKLGAARDALGKLR